jgi:hypothetical protein
MGAKANATTVLEILEVNIGHPALGGFLKESV